MSTIQEEIQKDIEGNDIILYMKGTPDFPQCGFSARVVELLNHAGVTFTTRDVLSREELRQGIKSYSNWPTIPQLYVRGEFIGGCDIVNELHTQGKLKELLQGSSTTGQNSNTLPRA